MRSFFMHRGRAPTAVKSIGSDVKILHDYCGVRLLEDISIPPLCELPRIDARVG